MKLAVTLAQSHSVLSLERAKIVDNRLIENRNKSAIYLELVYSGLLRTESNQAYMLLGLYTVLTRSSSLSFMVRASFNIMTCA